MTAWAPLAVTRDDIAQYVDTLFLIYLILIFVRVLMSWFPRIPYNPVLSAVLNFVQETTDPYLNIFRKFVPMVRIGPGALDLSPIVAIIVLMIVRAVVVSAIAGQARAVTLPQYLSEPDGAPRVRVQPGAERLR